MVQYKELVEIGFEWYALVQWCGTSVTQLRELGFTDAKDVRLIFEEHGAAVRAATEGGGKKSGYSLKELLVAGVLLDSLRHAGFPLKELRKHGFTAAELHDAGFPAHEFDSAAGFAVQELVDAGFAENDLKDAGYQQKEIDAVLRPPKKAPPRRKK